ncbi:MAG: aspartate carbamoyltransferase catalytic subunit [Alphaproteobacteria bacterium CG11_big_fil_rev_8_21_14_0_20_44_7]|nr:MAG: aspartate carbamoyltransferase catalytic subunit [Alphaproteobacteria bacterium CG11_big_fil_rev_8_21_14_0_20_44_7]
MKHLLSIADLSPKEIEEILDRANHHRDVNRHSNKKQAVLAGRTLINLFVENSTRTITSFELAGKRLGADVITMQADSSSLRKGETLIDTAMTLNAMHPDFIVVRHQASGAVKLLADKVNCSVINAGDGCHEHPTQALLDAVTIRNAKGKLKGLEIAICGDILHSRVARSNIILLTKMGAKVRVIAPPTLMPNKEFLTSQGVKVFTDMEAGVKNVDIIMMLRLQKERMRGSYLPSPREYYKYYGLNAEKLALAKDDAKVMHPGPINRGVEIASDIADDIHRSIILEQVEMGVAVRQAILENLG